MLTDRERPQFVDWQGGGVILKAATLTVTFNNCRIYSNETGGSGRGAGVAIADGMQGSVDFIDCEIYSNVANSGDGYGGGVSCSFTTHLDANAKVIVTFTRCTIRNNRGSGGGVWASGENGGALKLYHNTFVDNDSSGSGATALEMKPYHTGTGYQSELFNNTFLVGSAVSDRPMITWLIPAPFRCSALGEWMAPKVRQGGYVVGHDYCLDTPDVISIVTRLRAGRA